MSSAAEARIVSLLRADVDATVGTGHLDIVVQAAARGRLYATDPAAYAGAVVDEVQQYFHDAFVDTTWPRCPHHGNHPLWFSDGSWRCERLGRPVAALGGLAQVKADG